MTRDDIISMAQEADVWVAGQEPYQAQLERFAALVAAEKDREILALKEERRKDMAEIHSLRESEESLREENEQFAALIGEYAAEQAPDALRKVVADRDALQTENEKLREQLPNVFREGFYRGFQAAFEDAAKESALQGETAIWSARNDPRE